MLEQSVLKFISWTWFTQLHKVNRRIWLTVFHITRVLTQVFHTWNKQLCWEEVSKVFANILPLSKSAAIVFLAPVACITLSVTAILKTALSKCWRKAAAKFCWDLAKIIVFGLENRRAAKLAFRCYFSCDFIVWLFIGKAGGGRGAGGGSSQSIF